MELQEIKGIPFHANDAVFCNSPDEILESARNALRQYPRFSLDGKDAIHRSFFRPSAQSAMSALLATPRRRFDTHKARSPANSVIWCKPCLVAKLMGLNAIPKTKSNF